jgi:hypothetical protein
MDKVLLVTNSVVVQDNTGIRERSSGTSFCESVGRGFEPRPPHVSTASADCAHRRVKRSGRRATPVPPHGRDTRRSAVPALLYLLDALCDPATVREAIVKFAAGMGDDGAVPVPASLAGGRLLRFHQFTAMERRCSSSASGSDDSLTQHRLGGSPSVGEANGDGLSYTGGSGALMRPCPNRPRPSRPPHPHPF